MPATVANTVEVIDPASYRVIARLRVGRGPAQISPDWDLRRLWVQSLRSRTLTELNPLTSSIVRTVRIDAGHGLYFSPDGRRAIVGASRPDRLEIRDRRSLRLRSTVPLRSVVGLRLDFTAGGGSALVAERSAGNVVRVDLGHSRISGSVHVGGVPSDIALGPTGRIFYVANMARGGVSLIDPRRMIELGFIATGAGAHNLCLSRNGATLFVANRSAGTVGVVDLKRQRLRRTWQVGGGPDTLSLSADGRQLWVSGRYAGLVYVLDTRTGRTLRTIRVDAGPRGLSFFPGPGRHSLGANGRYR